MRSPPELRDVCMSTFGGGMGDTAHEPVRWPGEQARAQVALSTSIPTFWLASLLTQAQASHSFTFKQLDQAGWPASGGSSRQANSGPGDVFCSRAKRDCVHDSGPHA